MRRKNNFGKAQKRKFLTWKECHYACLYLIVDYSAKLVGTLEFPEQEKRICYIINSIGDKMDWHISFSMLADLRKFPSEFSYVSYQQLSFFTI